MTALHVQEDNPPNERPTDPVGSPPPEFLDPLDLRTPVPPQDLVVLVAEMTAQARNWRAVADDERVPEDVRELARLGASQLSGLLLERAPTNVSDLAPESSP